MRGTVLMERTTTGLTVELCYWNGEHGLADPVVYIVAHTESAERMAEIPPDKALDAFAHPCAYFADPSVFA